MKTFSKMLAMVLVAFGMFSAANADEKVIFADDFTKVRWGHSGGLAKPELVAGPKEGQKAMKLVFDINGKTSSYPQVQRYLNPKYPFPENTKVIVEFDVKIERVNGTLNLAVAGVNFGDFVSTKMPFLDDDKWTNVKIEISPRKGKTNVSLDRISINADVRKVAKGTKVNFLLANMKVYPAAK
ncbi:MAG: hypothetical protein E7052_08255 [Lentisphaerae bacterium]|nr:hypothetical protein [Lentisphaerota bacterium]